MEYSGQRSNTKLIKPAHIQYINHVLNASHHYTIQWQLFRMLTELGKYAEMRKKYQFEFRVLLNRKNVIPLNPIDNINKSSLDQTNESVPVHILQIK